MTKFCFILKDTSVGEVVISNRACTNKDSNKKIKSCMGSCSTHRAQNETRDKNKKE